MTVAGIDVGSRRDLTALVGLDGRDVGPLALMPRDVPLADQAARLAPLVRDCELVAVDATGLGLGLAEALAALSVPVAFVTFSAGETVWRDGSRYVAGKVWLVRRLAVAIGGKCPRLNVTNTILGSELVSQLGNMTARITPRGGVKMEAPGAAADDLAMALALALLAQDVSRAMSSGQDVPRRSA